ncbi:MAG: efflux RND transporter periplasmic adaptor subunit [Pseudomonadota bacterium]
MRYSVFVPKRVSAFLWLLFLSVAAVMLSSPVSPVSAAQEMVHSPDDGNGQIATEESTELPGLIASEADSAKPQFKYVCPMHPQIIRDHEGVCPICGMDLVKQAFKQSGGAPQVTISDSASGVKGLSLGLAIRTTDVQKTTLWKYIPTFGKVVMDESKLSHIHPRASGWMSDLQVRADGESIKKGALLYRLYSPEIVSAQQDFLQVIQSRKRLGNSATALIESAKIRLELLGLNSTVIQKIRRQRKVIHKVPVYAAQSGVITNLTVQEGMYIQPETKLMSIVDLSTVWVEAEVLPLQQAWIKAGITANLTTDAQPGRRWESAISYIYPETDLKTQALTVRLPVINENQLLKPNQIMDIELYGGPKHNVVAIPLEAIIDDGMSKRVVVKAESGAFKSVEITTGMQSDNIVEVSSGLNSGQTIVLSGQFLIDSESQIQSNLRRLLSTDAQE